MTTFLTLPATSEKAMKFYETSFPKAQIKRITRYTENVPNASKEMIGKVLMENLKSKVKLYTLWT
ncbi:VOC family protein [Flavobacterium paronense]|nr:VOC family protein [Flavobacterium paronense]MDN3675964.1 VOC family protein [Flavobacterium paronense]